MNKSREIALQIFAKLEKSYVKPETKVKVLLSFIYRNEVFRVSCVYGGIVIVATSKNRNQLQMGFNDFTTIEDIENFLNPKGKVQ